MSLSHEDYLLLILADGQWHSTASILREHPMMVHSRASDLRIKRGLNVEHRTVGVGAAGSEYRLVSDVAGGPLTEGEPALGLKASRLDDPESSSPSPSESGLSFSGRADTRAGGRQASPAGFLPGGSDEYGVPLAARPLNDRPLNGSGEHRDQEPHPGGSPGAFASSREAEQDYTPPDPLSGCGSPHGGAADHRPVEHGAPLAAHLVAPAQGLQESLLASGQLSLTEEAA